MTDIYVDIDGQRIKLTGSDRDAQIEHSTKLEELAIKQQNAREAKSAALESARAKLAALGLTEAEVKAIIGG
jgi:ribosomal protein L6P/L9E